MTKLKEYIVNSDGWVAGHRRKKGDVVELTAGQAKYEDVVLKAEAKYEDVAEPLAKPAGSTKKTTTPQKKKAS